MNNLKTYLIAMLAGIVYATGFPTPYWMTFFVTPIIGFAILGYLYLNSNNSRHQLLLILSFCFSANLFAYYWIPQTLVEFGNLPLPLGNLLWQLFVLIIMPQLWTFHLLHLLIKKFDKNFDLKQFNNKGHHRVIIAALLALLEYFTPMQFPSHISSPWVEIGSYINLASVGGLPLFSFFSYLVVFEALNFVMTKKFSPINAISIPLFILANLIYRPNISVQNEPYAIRIVQANISNFLKNESIGGDFPSTQKVIDTYLNQTLLPYENPHAKSPELIIWPETAYPYSLTSAKNSLQGIFQELIDKTNAGLFIGSYETALDVLNTTFESEYNSAFYFSKQKQVEGVYHKKILIPFGETLPFGALNVKVAKYLPDMAFFKRGEEFTNFQLKENLYAMAAICYEVLKPEYIREYLNNVKNRPNLLINLTNDSWYGKTSEPYQHLFLTKWRALENRLTIIRSTNTGISVVIDPYAQESKRLAVYTQGNLDISIPIYNAEATAFQKWGALTLLPLILCYLIFHIIWLRYRGVQN